MKIYQSLTALAVLFTTLGISHRKSNNQYTRTAKDTVQSLTDRESTPNIRAQPLESHFKLLQKEGILKKDLFAGPVETEDWDV